MTEKRRDSRKYWLGGKRKAEQDQFFKHKLECAGWRPGDEGDWDAGWFTGMPPPAVFKRVGPGRKINHIPGNSALTVKSRLFSTVTAMRDRVEERHGPGHELVSRLDFLPRVYAMPGQYHQLQQAAVDNPGQRWILKPKNSARGQGIRVVGDVGSVPMGPRWMLQEYLDRPHTMHQRKYVLRLYLLIASIDPLRVYLYRHGFAKLASAPWDIDDADNPYSQLTNPDINALNLEAAAPVEFVEFERYRAWLREQGHDDEQLFARIRDLATLTAISAVESMRARTCEWGVDPRGCYELLGIDCLVDDQLKPWLLECNLSPSMGVCAGEATGGPQERDAKASLLSDMIDLVDLDPSTADLRADPAERIRAQARQELARAGGFERLWPCPRPERYLPYFGALRLGDMILAEEAAGGALPPQRMASRQAREVIVEDRLALYDETRGTLAQLNPVASLIWLMAMQGADPETIATQVERSAAANDASTLPAPWEVRRDVRDALADWAHLGLLSQVAADTAVFEADRPDGARIDPRDTPATGTDRHAGLFALQLAGRRVDVHVDSLPVLARLRHALATLECDGERPADSGSQLQVMRDMPGYTLVRSGEVVASRRTLADLVGDITRQLLQLATPNGGVALDVTIIDRGDPRVPLLVVAGGDGLLDDGMLSRLARDHRFAFSRGLVLDLAASGKAIAMGLPAWSSDGAIPSSGQPSARDRVVEALVMLRGDGDHTRGGLGVMAVDDALVALLHACRSTAGDTLAADLLQALVGWLSERTLHSLDASDPHSAAATLSALDQKYPVAHPCAMAG